MPPKAGRNTNHKAPTFTLEDGTVLELKKIPLLLYQRHEYEYRRDYPEPQPPVAVLSNGETQILTGDETFKAQKDLWDGMWSAANLEWVLNIGIITNPPDGWRNTTGVFKDNPRLAWLYSLISIAPDKDTKKSELDHLSDAIVGLTMATEAAIVEAQKN